MFRLQSVKCATVLCLKEMYIPYLKIPYCWDFPVGPVVKTPSFTAGGTGLIPAQGTKILHDKWPKKRKKKMITIL